MRSLIFLLLAVGVMTGVAHQAAAFENDNNRSTRDARSFYDKLDSERGN